MYTKYKAKRFSIKIKKYIITKYDLDASSWDSPSENKQQTIFLPQNKSTQVLISWLVYLP